MTYRPGRRGGPRKGAGVARATSREMKICGTAPGSGTHHGDGAPHHRRPGEAPRPFEACPAKATKTSTAQQVREVWRSRPSLGSRTRITTEIPSHAAQPQRGHCERILRRGNPRGITLGVAEPGQRWPSPPCDLWNDEGHGRRQQAPAQRTGQGLAPSVVVAGPPTPSSSPAEIAEGNSGGNLA